MAHILHKYQQVCLITRHILTACAAHLAQRSACLQARSAGGRVLSPNGSSESGADDPSRLDPSRLDPIAARAEGAFG